MSSSAAAPRPESRVERKERTRRAIMDATLHLCEDSSLVAVSLRQVAKEVGIVPTAFYRHFDSIEALGLALVEESFQSLRAMLRDVRRADPAFSDIIDRSVSVVVGHTRSQHDHFAFISRERLAGPPSVREAIHHQIELVQRELASDLARQVPTTWSADDIATLSDLIVTLMVGITEALLWQHPDREPAIVHQARTQLRMLLVGAMRWQSRPE